MGWAIPAPPKAPASLAHAVSWREAVPPARAAGRIQKVTRCISTTIYDPWRCTELLLCTASAWDGEDMKVLDVHQFAACPQHWQTKACWKLSHLLLQVQNYISYLKHKKRSDTLTNNRKPGKTRCPLAQSFPHPPRKAKTWGEDKHLTKLRGRCCSPEWQSRGLAVWQSSSVALCMDKITCPLVKPFFEIAVSSSKMKCLHHKSMKKASYELVSSEADLSKQHLHGSWEPEMRRQIGGNLEKSNTND